MSQARTTPPQETALPGEPVIKITRPLTPQQQAEALRRIHAAATERAQMGAKLFKATDQRYSQQQQLIEQLKQDHEQLARDIAMQSQTLEQRVKQAHDQLNEHLTNKQNRFKDEIATEVTKSIQAYDQWVGKMDEQFTHRLQDLESKLDALQAKWSDTEEKISSLTRRAETLLDTNRHMLEDSRTRPAQIGKVVRRSTRPDTPSDAPEPAGDAADAEQPQLSTGAPPPTDCTPTPNPETAACDDGAAPSKAELAQLRELFTYDLQQMDDPRAIPLDQSDPKLYRRLLSMLDDGEGGDGSQVPAEDAPRGD